jgi:MFS superfamily sulfate permease-like transporter
MLRRLVYVATFVVVGLLLLVAIPIPEVRLGFFALAMAIVFGAWWVTRRLPARSMSIRELRTDAVIALIVGVGLAVSIPSTRVLCDCPMPLGAPVAFSCNCAIDHHTILRLSVALVGVGFAVGLAALARIRQDPSLAS